MNVRQWREEIWNALSQDANLQTDRTGDTAYHRLIDRLEASVAEGSEAAALDAIVEIWIEGRETDPEWWIKFANVFEAFAPAQQRTRVRLWKTFLRHRPLNDEAAAYALRVLSFIGCNIDWQQIENLSDVEESNPLVLADAMVFSEDLDHAIRVVRNAKDRALVQRKDIEEMMRRWKTRVKPHEYDRLERELLAPRPSKEVSDFASSVPEDRYDRIAA